tara:strand:+ start:5157 stop:5936 length:780 start_codon:yes stop_codon:yes gene_type:complete
MTFKDKVIIITGGNRGIGKEIALNLTRQGAIVQIIDLEQDKNLLRNLKQHNQKNEIYICSVNSLDGIKKVKEKIMLKLGKIDYLVNNAGIVRVSAFEDQNEKDWKDLFSVNVLGVMIPTKIFGKEMINNKRGKIVNIASTDAIVGKYSHDTELGVNNVVAYSASKGAVVTFTRALSVEWGKYNINVNAVAPVLVETPMTKHLFKDGTNKLNRNKELPLANTPSMNEVSNAVCFLLSKDSDKITGQILKVDCGYLARGEL